MYVYLDIFPMSTLNVDAYLWIGNSIVLDAWFKSNCYISRLLQVYKAYIDLNNIDDLIADNIREEYISDNDDINWLDGELTV